MKTIYQISNRIKIPACAGMTASVLTVIALLFSLTLGSCKKYVDEARNSQVQLQSATDAQNLLNNYTVMNTNYPSDGEVSTDDYYLTDAAYLQPALNPTDRDLYTWATAAIRPLANPQWQAPYNVVYNANLVLEATDRLKGIEQQATLTGLRGQALFFRAYALWNIAQLYAKPYVANTAATDMGIPLFLSSAVTTNYNRRSLQQTYNQILQDLQEAATLLPNTVPVASAPSKVAAYAMLARVYLSMEDYPNALANSTLALNIKSTLVTYTNSIAGFNPPFARYNAEVIFQSLMAAAPALNPGTAAEPLAKIDPVLIASYDVNDLRSKILVKVNTDNTTYRFTGNYEPSALGPFFNGLAVDELLLIRAECNARAGALPAVVTDMNTLLSKRWSGAYPGFTATDANDATTKVLAERRKELLMRGQRWSDLRRLNKTGGAYAKVLSRSALGATYTLPIGDPRYTLLIPDEVILKSGGSIQQNR